MRQNRECTTPMIAVCAIVVIFMLSAEVWADTKGGEPVVSGQYQLRLQSTVLEGDEEQFHADTGEEAGTQLEQHLALVGSGQLSGGWSLEGSYDTRHSVPERLEWRLSNPDAELSFGSRHFRTGGPGLLAWDRLLTGLQTTLTLGADRQLQLRAAWGQPLGVPASEVLVGRGLVGPYLLSAAHLPIVTGSEKVRIDQRHLVRDVDYRIDYRLGAITFREPVLENSRIEVEYEYQAVQAGQAAVGAVHWRQGPVSMHLLTGKERTQEIGRFPLQRQMHGAAVMWQVTPTARLVTSWLAGAEDAALGALSTAWQLGGEWLLGQGKAGFDYRAVPQGFRPPGRTPNEVDYRLLTAGYEYLLGNWHSKLNVRWHQTPFQPLGEEDPLARLQTEHVLSYVTRTGLVGWSVGMDERWRNGRGGAGITMGVLGSVQWGDWQLRAERQGLVASMGELAKDASLSSTRLSAELLDHRRWEALLQWEQDRHTLGGDLAEKATVWRLTTSSQPASSPAYWHVRWLQSEMLRSGYTSARVAYGRVEAGLPLWLPGLSGDMSLTLSNRRGHDAVSHATGSLQAGAHYRHGGAHLGLMAAESYAVSDNSEGRVTRHQETRGIEVSFPLRAALTYRGSLYLLADQDEESVDQGLQQNHSVGWAKGAWQTEIGLTAGVLDQPPVGDGEEEEDDKKPLRDIPVGQRLSLRRRYSTQTVSLETTLERDWESHARAWRGEIQGSIDMGQAKLEAFLSCAERRTNTSVATAHAGQLAANWWLTDRWRLTLSAHHHMKKSPVGQGEYRATGLLGEWTAHF